ncbi:MAG: NGG1p interacting factor NIF3 [bacterium]|nr:NGG1p interacting factor NIF3 [bacterium]
MNIPQIYKLAIEMGIKNDFRPKSQIDKQLKRIKEKYEKLPKEEKVFFDAERLTNPYSDTRIHFDNGAKNIRKIMVGIDIDGAELMIARYMSNHNPKNPIDLVVAHHPVGIALSNLTEVMNLQADVLAQYGIPINIAESLLKIRIEEIFRKINPENHYQSVDAAKLLDINFMGVHTPADNLAASFVKKTIEKAKPEYVGDVIKSLLQIPEYREAAKHGSGPTIFAGAEENRTGKIAFTELTGGTSGSDKIYQSMSQAGIGTIIGMHMSEEHRNEAKKYHINVIIAGHMSTDSLGMNLFLDELEKRGIEIVPCGGLIRYSRVKK